MFSNNIVFMDGEFTGLHATGTNFLSVGLVKPNVGELNGNELYVEIEPVGDINDWTRENVLPYLRGEAVSAETAKKIIRQFVGDNKPYLIADVNQFDWMGICGLFGVFNVPFHYIPIDFSSLLWARGIDPDADRIELAKERGIDVSMFRKHNALDDARVLRALYESLRG